jgi:hypothetical protein
MRLYQNMTGLICVLFLLMKRRNRPKFLLYVEKLPFKPLPLKEGKKKKKKKKKKRRSKRREETVSSPKHVAPIIVFADESELNDFPMPVTYSSDHDWEKHTTFDIENLLHTNSENNDVNNCCTISAIHVPSDDDMFTNEHTLEDSYSIAYDDCDISVHLLLRKISYDYNMPPIFDDYGDENNNDSYFVEFTPTMINKNDYVYMESNNYFIHMDHDKNVFCDSYTINFIHDATEFIMREGNMVLCISTILSFPSLC